MTAYFQVKGSTKLSKIAVVNNVVDIESFRCDDNWYELSEEQYKALLNPVVVVSKPKKITKEL